MECSFPPAHNTSSTSVRISWKAPSLDTIHGEFLGYRITYRARDKQPEDIREIYIRDSNVEVRLCVPQLIWIMSLFAVRFMASRGAQTEQQSLNDFSPSSLHSRATKSQISRPSLNTWCRFRSSILKDSAPVRLFWLWLMKAVSRDRDSFNCSTRPGCRHLRLNWKQLLCHYLLMGSLVELCVMFVRNPTHQFHFCLSAQASPGEKKFTTTINENKFDDLFDIVTCVKLINHIWLPLSPFRFFSLPHAIIHTTVPSKPKNVRVLDVTSTSIKISWHEPERPNGVIHAYRVYYMFLNQTLLHLPMLKNDASVGPPFHYTLINLSEFATIIMKFD